MNGFLVILRRQVTDSPIGLHATRVAALAQAAGLMPEDEVGRDCSRPVNVSITAFVDGVPIKCEVVRVFDQKKAA